MIYFDPKNYEKLDNAISSSWWYCSRNRLILWALKKYFPDMKLFLEVGCGTGFVLNAVANAYPEADVTGAEYFEEGLEYARKKNSRAHFMQLDVCSINTSQHFEVIGAFDVLEHIQDDTLVLHNLYESLSSMDGKGSCGLVITVPQHPFLWSSGDEEACHVRRYTRKELVKKLKQAGFSIKYVSSFVSILLPCMYIVRKIQNKKASVYDELIIPRFINLFLEAIMWLEYGAMRLGVTFPFGGSLLAVAIKEEKK